MTDQAKPDPARAAAEEIARRIVVVHFSDSDAVLVDEGTHDLGVDLAAIIRRHFAGEKIEAHSKSGNSIIAFRRDRAQDYVGEVLTQLELLTEECEDMRKTVWGVARTADGILVVPGEKYFYIDPTGHIQGVNCYGCSYRDDSSHPSDVYLHSGQTYSTREAAAAAKEAKP